MQTHVTRNYQARLRQEINCKLQAVLELYRAAAAQGGALARHALQRLDVVWGYIMATVGEPRARSLPLTLADQSQQLQQEPAITPPRVF